MNKQSKKILSQFKALANPIRLDILEYLVSGEKCVCDIFDNLKLPQNLVSHHLSILREIKLIIARKEGKWVYYSLNPSFFVELNDFIGIFSSSKHKKKTESKYKC